VYWVVIATVTVVPGVPREGARESIAGGGLIVSEARFELANATPVEVDPAMETKYAVGLITEMLAGITNETRRVPPMTVTTVFAGVLAAAPVPSNAGVRLTVTSPGLMVPEGNGEPVTSTVWIPAWAAVGDAAGESVTAVWARAAEPTRASEMTSAIRVERWREEYITNHSAV
jgi:hypothetical protein